MPVVILNAILAAVGRRILREILIPALREEAKKTQSTKLDDEVVDIVAKVLEAKLSKKPKGSLVA